jgi:signal transduction histidine kinase
VHCEFREEHPVELLDPVIATHLYRIAQEAVREAVARGHATTIAVELRASQDMITLSIVDDGIDPREDGRAQSGRSLRTMRHRAHVIGGKLSVTSSPDGGAKVTCQVLCPNNK